MSDYTKKYYKEFISQWLFYLLVLFIAVKIGLDKQEALLFIMLGCMVEVSVLNRIGHKKDNDNAR
jgi:hypothetical protein